MSYFRILLKQGQNGDGEKTKSGNLKVNLGVRDVLKYTNGDVSSKNHVWIEGK